MQHKVSLSWEKLKLARLEKGGLNCPQGQQHSPSRHLETMTLDPGSLAVSNNTDTDA